MKCEVLFIILISEIPILKSEYMKCHYMKIKLSVITFLIGKHIKQVNVVSGWLADNIPAELGNIMKILDELSVYDIWWFLDFLLHCI